MNKIQQEKLKKGEWVYLASRELPLIFGTLIVKSYKETFQKLDLIDFGKSLVNDFFVHGNGLITRAYRKKSALSAFSKELTKTLKRDPDFYHKLYHQTLSLIRPTEKSMGSLKKRLKKRKWSQNDLEEFYALFRSTFLPFFALQVLPFTVEQAISSEIYHPLAKQHVSLFINWREKAQGVEIVLEKIFEKFLTKAQKDLEIDLAFWTDDEVINLVENQKKPAREKLAKRRKFYLMIWNIEQDPPFNLIIGIKGQAIVKRLEKITKAEKTGNALSGRTVYGGKIKAKAYVIKTKQDFERIPKGVIVIASVVEIDDLRFLKVSDVGGVVVEEGGVTTHIAVSGRELEIPIIVGIKDVHKIVKTGDLVEIDGEAGILHILRTKK